MPNKSKFWFQIARSKFLRRSKDTYDLIWFSLIWFDLMWCDVIWFDVIWFDLVWFDLVWFDLIKNHDYYTFTILRTPTVQSWTRNYSFCPFIYHPLVCHSLVSDFVIHSSLVLLSTVSGFSSTGFWFYCPLCCSSDYSPLIFPPLSSFLSSLFYSPLLSSIWIFLISIDYFSQFFLKSSRPNCGWWIWYSVRLAKIRSDFCTSVIFIPIFHVK